jgi:hypothetical protein
VVLHLGRLLSDRMGRFASRIENEGRKKPGGPDRRRAEDSDGAR